MIEAKNLYVHFPFCRAKCSYCALHSRAGSTTEERENYVKKIASQINAEFSSHTKLKTVYFGGGSPALCNLAPLGKPLSKLLANDAEFTVELNPLDVTEEKLDEIALIGANRISMGVQSLDDKTLEKMGRPYTAREARKAFEMVHRRFPNSGIDIIVGYPEDKSDYTELADWSLTHISVYSLILEPGTRITRETNGMLDDDIVMNRLSEVSQFLQNAGFIRYEVSNYAKKGHECRHNLAVWFGEDYAGFGEGAYGRLGLNRTGPQGTTPLDEKADKIERTIFRLRTRYGLESAEFPEWREKLDYFVTRQLLTRDGTIYALTSRGFEICDSILEAIL